MTRARPAIGSFHQRNLVHVCKGKDSQELNTSFPILAACWSLKQIQWQILIYSYRSCPSSPWRLKHQ